jgi:hypothetical protein
MNRKGKKRRKLKLNALAKVDNLSRGPDYSRLLSYPGPHASEGNS